MWHLTPSFLAKVFFWFGMICGLFAVVIQYSISVQSGTAQVFGDPMFFLGLGSLSMLAGIYLQSDKSKKLFW